ncbi:hypothetical protein L914_20020 [Phytophthora nicotianae]|uniref:Uncharacterized protein n=1 Tax=Phytophthora nicotianae TaxID=4792 RepID=W2MAN2_PHYNI|nr:hypothetical protein L914_20020 [Phytophthora nicotianae]
MVLPIRNVKSLQDMENQVGVGFADRVPGTCSYQPESSTITYQNAEPINDFKAVKVGLQNVAGVIQLFEGVGHALVLCELLGFQK